MIRFKTIALLVFVNFSLSLCQDIDVESLFDGSEESEDQSALVEYLELLLLQPLDLNSASIRKLSTIPWISSVVAVRIVQHRMKRGPFRSIEQIQKYFGAPVEFQKAKHFIKLKTQRSAAFALQGRHRVIAKKQDSRGYIDQKYSGGKEKVFNRIRGGYSSHLRFGIVLEKDAGEQKINDLTLGHIQWQMPKWGTKIIVGHFSAEFGQGLVFWGPYKMGKGSDPLAPARQRGRKLHPYLSSAENHSFYGVGISQKIARFDVNVFTSQNARDARLVNGLVISTPTSGLHRTESEVSVRDQFVEYTHGGALGFHLSKSMFFGATFQKLNTSQPIIQKGGKEQFDFSGSSNIVAGLNFDITHSKYNFFGEVARCSSGGLASTAGLLADLSAIEFILLWRRYDRDFQNRYAFAFGEKNGVENEKGLYLGLRWRPIRETSFSIYSDCYRFPWPYNNNPMPGSGHDLLCLIEHTFRQAIKAQVRLRSEIKNQSADSYDPFGNDKKIIVSPRKTSARIQIDIDPSRAVHLRSRIEFSFFEPSFNHNRENQTGLLMYQDFSWRIAKTFRLQSRWSFFDAPAADVRLYQFENDVPGVMRIKMLSGRGTRWYGMISYQWRKKLQATIKVEHTYYDDRDIIGSGYDAISGSTENIATIQFDWRF
jgi:hypothetical protein